MKISIRLPLCLTLMVTLCSCMKGFDVKSGAATGSDQSASVSQKIDFATVSSQVFQPMCVNCHSTANGNSGGINLETYQNAFSFKARIRVQVIAGTMPASGPALNATEKNLLVSWIDSGAPQFVAVAPTPTPTPLPVATPTPAPALNFATVYSQVFAPKCVSCHSAFSSYTSVKALISTIQTKVTTKVMPMGSTLTTAQYDTITTWINAGAPQ